MSISNCISSTANTVGNTAVRGGRTGICTQIQTGDEQIHLHTSTVGVACPIVGGVRDKCDARLRAWVVLSCPGSWWLGVQGEVHCDHTKTYSSLSDFQTSTCPWPTFCRSVPSWSWPHMRAKQAERRSVSRACLRTSSGAIPHWPCSPCPLTYC